MTDPAPPWPKPGGGTSPCCFGAKKWDDVLRRDQASSEPYQSERFAPFPLTSTNQTTHSGCWRLRDGVSLPTCCISQQSGCSQSFSLYQPIRTGLILLRCLPRHMLWHDVRTSRQSSACRIANTPDRGHSRPHIVMDYFPHTLAWSNPYSCWRNAVTRSASRCRPAKRLMRLSARVPCPRILHRDLKTGQCSGS